MGVAALIVAFALANGFRDEMREKILQGTSHLSVVRADGRPIENYSELASRVKQVNGVVTASATTYDGALVRGTKGSSYAVIRGVEKDTVQSRWLRDGSFGPLFEASSNPNAVVGTDLAARIGLALLDHEVAVFWPASGIAVGILVMAGPRARGAVVIGVVVVLSVLAWLALSFVAGGFERS